MKIYYETNTNKFAGAVHTSSEFKNSEDISFIEIEETEWLNFLNSNNGKLIKIVDEQLVSEEIIDTIEQIREKLINVRKRFLLNTDWYTAREIDEPSSYPIEIKNKRIIARREINEIEIVNEEDINNYSMEF